MSIPSPHARRYRDDTTVTVVVWDDSSQGTEMNATVNATPEEKGRVDQGVKDKVMGHNSSEVKAKL